MNDNRFDRLLGAMVQGEAPSANRKARELPAKAVDHDTDHHRQPDTDCEDHGNV